MATMLYSAELCPLTIKHMKTLEAAHHKFQRRLLGIKWYDRVSDVEVRKRTGTAKLEELIKERRLRWLVHVIRTEDCRIPNQREQETRKTPEKMAGHYPKTGLKDIGLTWDEASELAHCRSSWRQVWPSVSSTRDELRSHVSCPSLPTTPYLPANNWLLRTVHRIHTSRTYQHKCKKTFLRFYFGHVLRF